MELKAEEIDGLEIKDCTVNVNVNIDEKTLNGFLEELVKEQKKSEERAKELITLSEKHHKELIETIKSIKPKEGWESLKRS